MLGRLTHYQNIALVPLEVVENCSDAHGNVGHQHNLAFGHRQVLSETGTSLVDSAVIF
jgi:hypothetical protein